MRGPSCPDHNRRLSLTGLLLENTDYGSNWTSGPSRIGLGTGPFVEKTMVPLLFVAKYRRAVTPTFTGLALAKYEVAGGCTESLQVLAGGPASVTPTAASFPWIAASPE